MSKNYILFGLIGGGVVGLLLPRLFGAPLGLGNFVAAAFGAIIGLFGVGAYVHFSGRIR